MADDKEKKQYGMPGQISDQQIQAMAAFVKDMQANPNYVQLPSSVLELFRNVDFNAMGGIKKWENVDETTRGKLEQKGYDFGERKSGNWGFIRDEYGLNVGTYVVTQEKGPFGQGVKVQITTSNEPAGRGDQLKRDLAEITGKAGTPLYRNLAERLANEQLAPKKQPIK